MLLPATLLLVAYILGSIPFSWIFVRLMARADIREHGSGNVGATNAIRSFGASVGSLALLFDVGKGAAAVLLARWILEHPRWPWAFSPGAGGLTDPLRSPSFWIGLAATMAVIGHIAPIWLALRGGKGVATAAGAFLAISPLAGLIGMLVFAAAAIYSRYVSIGSVAGAVAMPLALRYVDTQPEWIVILSSMISLLVIAMHRTNLSRITRGEEAKIGQPKEDD